MKRGHNRHIEPGYQFNNICAGLAAENTVFVLEAYSVET